MNHRTILQFILLSTILIVIGYSQDTTLVFSGESEIFITDTHHPYVSVLSPNGGDSYDSGEEIEISWEATDDPSIEISITIYLSTSMGGELEYWGEDLVNSGSVFLELPELGTSFAMVKIIASDYFNNQSEDLSDSYFTIEAEQGGGNQGDTTLVFFSESNLFISDTKSPIINISSPNGGEDFDGGEVVTISWDGSDDSFGNTPISIYHSNSIGGFFNSLILDISNSGSILQRLPEINSGYNLLKIYATDDFGNSSEDESNGYFIIGDPPEWTGETQDTTISFYNSSIDFTTDTIDPYIDLISPNGGEQFDSGETITIEWEAEDDTFDENPIDIEIAMEIGGYFIPLLEDIPNTENIEMELPEADQAFVRLRLNATDSFGNSSDDAGDNYFILGDPFGEYNVNPLDDIVVIDWGWGEYQMIYVENDALDFLNDGDEIHVIDQNGIITEDCADAEAYGVVSVASHPYIPTNSPYGLYSVGGVDYCEESEYIAPGYVEGNPINFAHYDQSENTLNYLQPEYDSGNGLFGVEFEDTLRFQYFDESENLVYDLYETIIFSPDMIEGNAINPVQFTVNYSTEISGTPDWEIDFHDYEFNGSITSAVYEMGELITDSGDRIAAFVNNVCRGTIDAVETPDPMFEEVVFHLMVYGNLPITIVTSFSESVSRFSDTGNMFNASNRDLNQFNVYRNNVLVGDAISNFFYMDETTEAGEDYCYQIMLLDDEGNELLESMEQCIGIEQEIEYILGDVTQDGLVNVLDVVMLVNWILSGTSLTDLETSIADMTNDGLVNVLDIVALVNTILNP